MVDIKGLDKARVLKALYDHSHVQGLGFMQAAQDGDFTVEHCAELLEQYTYFDYLRGRVLKVDLSRDEFDERLYDRDCGEGAAQRAVDSIKGAPESSENTAKETDGEKKELTKVLDLLTELPPDTAYAASVVLKAILPGTSTGGLAGMLMMGGPFAPPFMRFDIRAGEKKERDTAPPFPWDLSSMSRQG